MSTQVIIRKGTAAQNNAFTGAAGEITIDTTTWNIRIHDGTTPGGAAKTLQGNALNSGYLSVSANLSAGGNVIGANLVTVGNVDAGNINGGNLSVTGNATATYFLGNGALLTGVSTTSSNINNGTSNVTVVSSGGNITVSVGGTGNIAVFSSTGLAVTGSITQNNVSTTTRAAAMSLIYGG